MTRQSFTGRAAAAGVALGLLHRPDRPPTVPRPRRPGTGPAAEVEDAFDAVAKHLAVLSDSLRSGGRTEQADIMEVNSYLAQDPDLRASAARRVAEGAAPAVAVQDAVSQYADLIGALDDPALAERATDIRQVGRRALAWLQGADLAAPAGPLVLLAHEIGAADLLEPGTEVVAAVSVTGGPNSHAAIVARSLGIPLLLGLDPAVLELSDGAEAVVDAAGPHITVHPAPAERALALAAMDAARSRRVALAAERHLPCETLDRYSVILRANIATAEDAASAVRAGPTASA